MSITDFIASWGLFAEAYSLTLLAAVVLAIVGVVATARRQVFMAAAVAQASTLGYALFAVVAGVAASELLDAVFRDVVILGSAVIAALATMLGQGQTQGKRLDGDERTAWVFIFSGAGAILVLAQNSQGMEQFRRLQTSSVIGATWVDLAAFSTLLLAVLAVLLCAGRSLVLLLADPVMASAIGMRIRRWNLGLAVFCGLCVGLGVRSAGMLFTFGCLVVPVMIAKQACGNVRSLFLASPLIAATAAVVGLWLSYVLDLPPGQVVVTLLCMLLVPAVAGRRLWDG